MVILLFIINYPQEIILLISEWHDGLAFNALSQIDVANHPFSKAILMIPRNVAPYDINRLSSIQSNIDLTIQKRNNDYMDICDAQIETEYFMIKILITLFRNG